MTIKNSIYHIPNTKYLFVLTLFLLAFLFRTTWHLGPNIEFVTAAMLLSAAYVGRKQSLWLTLAIILSTDLILGNTNIFIFTWSGFLIPAFVFPLIIENWKLKIGNFYRKVAFLTITGLFANLFFFIHTNFGVWILDSWGMYSKDFQGLVYCYFNALPFLRYQTLSTLLFVPSTFALTEFAIFLNKKYQLVKRFSQILRTDFIQI